MVQELNDAVAGSYVDEAPETLISGNPGFFASFDMVIATQACRHNAQHALPQHAGSQIRSLQ